LKTYRKKSSSKIIRLWRSSDTSYTKTPQLVVGGLNPTNCLVCPPIFRFAAPSRAIWLRAEKERHTLSHSGLRVMYSLHARSDIVWWYNVVSGHAPCSNSSVFCARITKSNYVIKSVMPWSRLHVDDLLRARWVLRMSFFNLNISFSPSLQCKYCWTETRWRLCTRCRHSRQCRTVAEPTRPLLGHGAYG